MINSSANGYSRAHLVKHRLAALYYIKGRTAQSPQPAACGRRRSPRAANGWRATPRRCARGGELGEAASVVARLAHAVELLGEERAAEVAQRARCL